mmetsp:Transcript_9663/g.27545  ORF Transcript_9663/g.27545 Transcript_9663/m.27545 type:complete len:216 (+) Transcript_9663:67-714(+)
MANTTQAWAGRHVNTYGQPQPPSLKRPRKASPFHASAAQPCTIVPVVALDSRAINADVEMALVLRDLFEAFRDERVLPKELPEAGPLDELHGLRVAIRQPRRRPHQRLALVDTVAERVDVLPLRRVDQGLGATSPDDLRFEGLHLPVQRRGARGALVRGACGDDLHLLDDRQEGRDELQAAQLDPTSLGIRQQHHSAVLLCEAQGLHGCGCDLTQ